MIFQHTIDKVLSGEKTQTRRIIKPKPGYAVIPGYLEEYGKAVSINSAYMDNYRLSAELRKPTITHFEVGKTYAAQPGRGKKAVARIRITGIRWQPDVRDISWDDVRAEGFRDKVEFFSTWMSMHDKSVYKQFRDYDFPCGLKSPAHALLMERPAECYQAWVLEFKLVTP